MHQCLSRLCPTVWVEREGFEKRCLGLEGEERIEEREAGGMYDTLLESEDA